ncbi:auxin-repressed protein isoform X2 [Zea mays]|uniref:auxin-repressed protein isoform X2 n=1 Tax=Zea mays TaxID=4577 RepID=UPI0009A96A10|nr:auxin-repressed protein isoform X2 [Zea mays]|eukprot:XP_020404092.1 dormancy-associated protein homolog 3 isoform X2 [Zea mays]
MGLLNQLWDDTVAGPRPDSGLGKLRKYASFSPSSSSSAAVAAAAAAGSAPPPGAVTRSLTMLRRPAALSVVTSPRSESSSAPSSPSPASGAPDSPFGAATTPRGEGWTKKLRGKARMGGGGGDDAPGTPRSPTVYDWILLGFDLTSSDVRVPFFSLPTAAGW